MKGITKKLNSANSDQELAEIAKEQFPDVDKDKRPASKNAIEVQSFSTPNRNIVCDLSDGVQCVIHNYAFESTCEGKESTYSIKSDGSTNQECSNNISTSPSTLSYGTEVKNQNYSCKIDDKGGVECWNAKNGKGFILSIDNFETF